MSKQKLPFNDDYVSSRLADLLALKIDRLVINNDQIVKVGEILELASSSAEQLQAKRNSVVKLLTENADDDAAWATMSGVTCVIDTYLMQLRPV